jgi:hypothetical protein
MDRPKCATCPFWKQCPDDKLGECRALPPRPYLSSEVDGDDGNPAWWPLTHEMDWCGSHPGMTAWIAAEGARAGAEAD